MDGVERRSEYTELHTMALNLPKCRLWHVHTSFCFPLDLPMCRSRHVHNSVCFEHDSVKEDLKKYDLPTVPNYDPNFTLTLSLNKCDVPNCGRKHRHSSSCFEQDSYMFDLPPIPADCPCYNLNLTIEQYSDTYDLPPVPTINPTYMFALTMFINNYPSEKKYYHIEDEIKKKYHNGDENIYGPSDVGNWADIEEFGSRGT